MKTKTVRRRGDPFKAQASVLENARRDWNPVREIELLKERIRKLEARPAMNIPAKPPLLVADGDTSPDVSSAAFDSLTFVINNTTATTIINFSNGKEGQTIALFFKTGYTTIQDGTNILLHNSTNYNPPASTWIGLRRHNGKWYEQFRVNT